MRNETLVLRLTLLGLFGKMGVRHTIASEQTEQVDWNKGRPYLN